MTTPSFNIDEIGHAISKLREFCLLEGLKEVYVQHRKSILAACEDPETLSVYYSGGVKWPLPQTGQMQLEVEMLKDPNAKGFFTVTTSYRDEPHLIEDRRYSVFPMFEVEIEGDMEKLIDFEERMLKHLGFNMKDRARGDWVEVAESLGCSGTNDISHKEEQRLWKERGPIFFLCNFPFKTSPFWNMKLDDDNKDISKKVDVILYGMETIGSAERSCNPEEMRCLFHAISEGKYAGKLYSEFTKERVDEELEGFLSFNFRPRSGFGMGLSRLIRAMNLADLFPK